MNLEKKYAEKSAELKEMYTNIKANGGILTEEYRALKEEVKGLKEVLQEESKMEELVVEEVEEVREVAQPKDEIRNAVEGLVDNIRNSYKGIAISNPTSAKVSFENQEVRALTTTSRGNVVPTTIAPVVIKKLEEVAPLFNKIPMFNPDTTGSLEILRETNIGNAGFVGEMSGVEKKDFVLEKVKLEQRRCGSAVELSQHLINDSGIDIVGYATDILYRRLGYALDRTVVNGKIASNQFEGLVNAPETCDVEVGVKDVITYLDFYNAYMSMHPELQAGAVWVMNRETFNKLALLTNPQTGLPLMLGQENNIVNGTPQYRLLGCEILINDAVGTEGADTTVAYLVNFQRAYAGRIIKDVEFFNISNDTSNRIKGATTLGIDMYTDAKIVDPQGIRVLKNKTA